MDGGRKKTRVRLLGKRTAKVQPQTDDINIGGTIAERDYYAYG